MDELNAQYWEDRYRLGYTGWDLGHVSGAMRHIIDQLKDRQQKILVPGAGNGYEVAYLYEKGFSEVYLLDWAAAPLEAFSIRHPAFPKKQLLHADFFALKDTFDLVLEQTFFCALTPQMRPRYVEKMTEILKEGGYLKGVLFKVPLFDNRPPFGGSVPVYQSLFSDAFEIEYMEDCIYSDPDRLDMEVEINLRKRESRL